MSYISIFYKSEKRTVLKRKLICDRVIWFYKKVLVLVASLNGQKRQQFPCKQHKNLSQLWLLKSFGLMLLFIEKFFTHTSPHKYFRPPLLNKHTKASQDATHSSQIMSSKLKTCRSGKHEFWTVTRVNYVKTNNYRWLCTVTSRRNDNHHKILVSKKIVLWNKILFYFMHKNKSVFLLVLCKYSFFWIFGLTRM